jgi:superfamily II DNA or RNA helicase
LGDELLELAIECGLPFNLLFVGSGRHNFNQYYARFANKGFTDSVSLFKATISPSEIGQFVRLTESQHRHLIIISTYHSFDLLSGIGQIDTCTCDEAHNTTSLDFTKNISLVRSNIGRLLFFTATRKVKGANGGMNDETFYGPVLYDAFPALMLSEGEIVCPRMHIIKAEDEGQETKITDLSMLVKNVIEAFLNHETMITKPWSFDRESFTDALGERKIAAKLLVSFPSVNEMMLVYRDPKFVRFCRNSGVKAFAVSSEEGGFSNFTDVPNRDQFMDKLNQLSELDKALIFNVEILTEGIDLPSITGVMPMRNLSKTRLLQLLGRALRLNGQDRSSLYGKILSPGEYEKYIKPYGWLIIPRHLSTLDHYQEMMLDIKTVMNEYATPVDELVIQETFVDPDHSELDSMIPFPMNDKKDFDLDHQTSDIVSDVIMDQIKNMSYTDLQKLVRS